MAKPAKIIPQRMLLTLRNLQESSFVETADIVEIQKVSDGMGGTTDTLVTIGTEPCRIAAMALARAEAVLGSRLQGNIPWEISLPLDTVARETHQIVVDDVTYEVIALWGPNTYGTTTKAICMRTE